MNCCRWGDACDTILTIRSNTKDETNDKPVSEMTLVAIGYNPGNSLKLGDRYLEHTKPHYPRTRGDINSHSVKSLNQMFRSTVYVKCPNHEIQGLKGLVMT